MVPEHSLDSILLFSRLSLSLSLLFDQKVRYYISSLLSSPLLFSLFSLLSSLFFSLFLFLFLFLFSSLLFVRSKKREQEEEKQKERKKNKRRRRSEEASVVKSESLSLFVCGDLEKGGKFRESSESH